jgi:fructose-bisphosphate aldolase class II
MYIDGKHLKKVIENAAKEKYGLIAANYASDVIARGIIQGADFSKSDIIVQISYSSCKFASGKKQDVYDGVRILCGIAKSIAKQYDVGVAINIDHCKPEHVDWLKFIINAKLVSMVMMDASELPLDENIKITKEIVKLAHKNDILVEGELGRIKGAEDEVKSEKVIYTNVDDAIKFVKETGVDLFAPAVGTAHGMTTDYKTEINVDLIKKLSEAFKKNKLDVGLVLHGSSAVSPTIQKRAVQAGVVKLNKDTTIQLEFAKAVQQYWKQNCDAVECPENIDEDEFVPDKDRFDYRKWFRFGEEYIETAAIKLFDITGSRNKSLFKK